MTTASRCVVALSLFVAGCGDTEETLPVIGIASLDAVSIDAEAPPPPHDAGHDTTPPPPLPETCTTDTECGALVCDPLTKACVECLFETQCEEPLECRKGHCVAPAPCVSSKDCTAQVCDKVAGECVDCLDDADCEDGEGCLGDLTCGPKAECKSDKQCTELGQLCDKDAGHCVECLSDADCPGAYHCTGGACAADACPAGAAKCVGNALSTCTDAGDGWTEPAACGATQNCLGGACVDWACTPGPSCAGESATLCAEDGSAVLDVQDCGAQGKACKDGACVDCSAFCSSLDAGPLDASKGTNVAGTPEGWVTLPLTGELRVLWVSNSGEHTVSKLDTDTGYEVARYNFCSDPSRTAADKYGNGWIGCRGGQKVAKILNYEAECIDKNGNGTIETSRDLDGSHTITPNEMLGADDECVLFVVGVPVASIVRGMAVDAQQHGWAALWEAKQLIRLNPVDGAIEQQIALPVNPYGIAMDKQGVIWVSGRGGNLLVRVDPATGQVTSHSPGGAYEPYGICVDEFGRVWTANCCGNHVVWMFDPSNGQWKAVGVHGRPRGLAANGNGRIFVANDQSNEVAVIDMQSMSAINFINTAPDDFPLGMAVDAAGFVWAVNQNSGSVTKIDGVTLEVVGHHPVGKAPYTYSDMTGSAFFGAQTQPGWFHTTFTAPKAVTWGQLSVDSALMVGTSIKVRVRSDAAATWSELAAPPVDAGALLGAPSVTFEAEVWLFPGPDGNAPVVKSLGVTFD